MLQGFEVETWSPQQVDIFAWFANGRGHLIGRARAGTGKTTTLIKAIEHAPERRILLCAFNKPIQEELQRRLRNPNARAQTIHSVGYTSLQRYWERVQVDRDGNRARDLTDEVCDGRTPDQIRRLITKLHTLGREMAPHAQLLGDLTAIAEAYDCEPNEQWREDGFDLDYVEERALLAMEAAAAGKPAKGIDYADMLFIPVRNRMLVKMYDLVVVDEAQDMNHTQLLIARGVCKGRMCLIGDDRQGIYAFRGADTQSLDRMKAELAADERGLTVSYRCAKRVGDLARRLVPDFETADSAPDGIVRNVGSITHAVHDARPGDFVLSRKNAPLMATACAFLRANKRVSVKGRDIGAGLKALVERLSKGDAEYSVDLLLSKIEDWADREIARAVNQKREDKIEQIRDKADTLRVLAEGVMVPQEIVTRIDRLFDDRGDPATLVTCSSVHRAKGLEADRVYVLRDTLYAAVPCECGHTHRFGPCRFCDCKVHTPDRARQQEEENIEYVAITRARRELVWVESSRM